MNHLELGLHESAEAAPDKFGRWVERVEALLGFSLDGHQDQDGYSVDFALDAFREGQTPEEHASRVRSKMASLAAH